MTPISTIVSAYMKFLDDEDGALVGEALECSVEKLIFVPRVELLNGHASRRACTVWDPLFKAMHHENSGLPDSIL
jgi:hypothetical protein